MSWLSLHVPETTCMERFHKGRQAVIIAEDSSHLILTNRITECDLDNLGSKITKILHPDINFQLFSIPASGKD